MIRCFLFSIEVGKKKKKKENEALELISVAGLQLGGCESDLGLMAAERGHHHYPTLTQTKATEPKSTFFCQGRFNKNPRRGKRLKQ